MPPRKSNIELLRIIAMLMVVLLHTNNLALGSPTREDVLLSPLTSFWRILAEQLCIVGVNVFVLISGWFGIKPSLKGLCSLLYQVIFWAVMILAAGLAFGLDIPLRSVVKALWFGSYYWFVIAYVGLYVLSPVLNLFAEKASPGLFLTVIVSFFILEFVFGWAVYSHSFNQGKSILSLSGIYLLSRYLRLYSRKLVSTKPAFDLLCYFVLTLIPVLISYLGVFLFDKHFRMICYTSPFVIAAAVFLFLSFSKLEFYNKTVNWIAVSTFSVYLIHMHPVILPYFVKMMQALSSQLSSFSYTFLIVILSLVYLLICAVLDKTRILSWRMTCSLFLDKLIVRVEKAFPRFDSQIQ